jgi:hypothetical protein
MKRLRGLSLDAYEKRVPAGHAKKPRKYPHYLLGTWRIGPRTGYGRTLEQLREVRIHGLEVPELAYGRKNADILSQLHPAKREAALLYAEQVRLGKRLPPIEIVETDRGNLRVIDGHRRIVAHLLAGRKRIRAWVSPTVDHPWGRKDSEGRILKVPLTVEILQERLPTKEV